MASLIWILSERNSWEIVNASKILLQKRLKILNVIVFVIKSMHSWILEWIKLAFILKVSKSRKQISKFSHTPKTQRNFVHFFALASKTWLKQKIKALDDLKGLFTTIKSFCFLTQPLLETRAKIYTKFLWFFGVWENLAFCFRDLLTFS